MRVRKVCLMRVQVQMYVCDEEAQNELVFLRIITYHVLSEILQPDSVCSANACHIRSGFSMLSIVTLVRGSFLTVSLVTMLVYHA